MKKIMMVVSDEELYDFSKQTGDVNYVHLKKEPVIQGLLILEHTKNLIENFHEI